MDAFAAIFARYPRLPAFAELQFGDKRMRSAEGLHELLAHGFADISVQDLSATRKLSPTQLWEWVVDMYDVHLLDEGDRYAVRDEYLCALGPLVGAEGTISHKICMRLVVAVAA